jgi:structural maintenance of chromosome 1
LPQRLKQAPRPSDRERLDDELRVETEAKLAALAKLEPNMKAIDQYESVKERELAQAEDLELKRSLTKHAQEAFESLKTTRTETFMAAFEHIASAIDRVYKELTQSESHPLGGTAYLSLESPEEPYNHGVKFTAMPPTKRFRDMEQLSGGEKTMAALALLFAIHRCVWARLSQIRHTARFTSNAGDCGGPITVTVVHTSSNTRPRHD